MKIYATRKEDDIYYQGPFWVITPSVLDMHRGNFNLYPIKFECDYNGKYIDKSLTRHTGTHKQIWEETDKSITEDYPYNYYPRGRVAVHNGIAFLHINSQYNIPKIINAIIEEYNLNKLEIEVEENDQYQGSHYEFLIK